MLKYGFDLFTYISLKTFQLVEKSYANLHKKRFTMWARYGCGYQNAPSYGYDLRKILYGIRLLGTLC